MNPDRKKQIEEACERFEAEIMKIFEGADEKQPVQESFYMNGNELMSHFKIGRSTVWKYVNEMEALGYDGIVRAAPNILRVDSRAFEHYMKTKDERRYGHQVIPWRRPRREPVC